MKKIALLSLLTFFSTASYSSCPINLFLGIKMDDVKKEALLETIQSKGFEVKDVYDLKSYSEWAGRYTKLTPSNLEVLLISSWKQVSSFWYTNILYFGAKNKVDENSYLIDGRAVKLEFSKNFNGNRRFKKLIEMIENNVSCL